MQLRGKSVFIYLHEKKLLIGTRSGPGACIQTDFECPTYIFDLASVTDSEIGNAVRQALSHCRRINLVPTNEVIEKHLTLIGVKNLKTLYKNTRSTNVDLWDEVLSVRATHQKAAGNFIGIDYEKSLPETATDEELGAMVRDVLAHCTTKY